jgi:hypothetical protein
MLPLGKCDRLYLAIELNTEGGLGCAGKMDETLQVRHTIWLEGGRASGSPKHSRDEFGPYC